MHIRRKLLLLYTVNARKHVLRWHGKLCSEDGEDVAGVIRCLAHEVLAVHNVEEQGTVWVRREAMCTCGQRIVVQFCGAQGSPKYAELLHDAGFQLLDRAPQLQRRCVWHLSRLLRRQHDSGELACQCRAQIVDRRRRAAIEHGLGGFIDENDARRLRVRERRCAASDGRRSVDTLRTALVQARTC